LNIHYNPRNTKDKREKERLAEIIRNKREAELLSSRYRDKIINDFPRQEVDFADFDFIEYFTRLAEQKQQENKRTGRAWLNTLKHLKNFAKAEEKSSKSSKCGLRFADISPKTLEDLKAYLLNEAKLSNNSAHLYFTLVKASLKQAVRDRIITGNFVSDVINGVKNITTKETQRAYLNIRELKKLVKTDCKNEEIKQAFLFSCSTGLRFSDVKALTWNQVILNLNRNGRGEGGRVELLQRKTGSSLYLPLSKTALAILREKQNGKQNGKQVSELVFKLPSPVYVWKTLKNWAQRAGISKNISFHTARHTFATLALSSGIDLYTVSELLGHKDIKTSQIYAKIIDKKKEEAMKKLHKIF
jgi:integrase